MKLWNRFLAFVLVFLAIFILPAFADATDLPPQDFFQQVLDTVRSLGGIPWTLKIAGLIMIVISSMKVSFIRPLWQKLGWVQGILGPIFGLIAGILMLSKDGSLNISGAMAYMLAGAGAIVLHELMDSLKAIPGIGPNYLAVINFMESLLKAPPKPEVQPS